MYNDFDSREQSADDASQGEDESREASSWVHTRDDTPERFVTRDDENEMKVFVDTNEEFTVEDSF